MLVGSGLIANSNPDRINAVQLGVREERGATRVDCLKNGRVMRFHLTYLGRNMAKADGRERRRCESLPAGFGVNLGGQPLSRVDMAFNKAR